MTGAPRTLGRFTALWLSQTVSVFGSAMTFFAATAWLAAVAYPRPEDQPALAAALVGLMLAYAVPTIATSPFAGAWADRHDRRQIMLVADAASAAASAVLAGLALAGGLSPVWLVALVATQRVFASFHRVAFEASYVMIVPDARLPRAHALVQTSWAVCNVLAPLLGVVLAALPAQARAAGWGGPGAWLAGVSHGWGLAFALDAASFAIAAAALPFIAIPSPERSEPPGQRSLWADVMVGARFIRSRPALLWLMGLFVATNLFGALDSVLLPLMVKVNLADDVGSRGLTFDGGFAILTAATSAGGIAGGIIIAAWSGLKRRRIYGVLVPMAGLGLCQIGLGLAPGLAFAAAMAFLREQMLPALAAHHQTIWQTLTPAELQGRVFGVRNLLADVSAPLGMLIGGLLAGWFDPGWIMAGAGAALLSVAALQLGSPRRHELEPAAVAPVAGGTASP